MDPTPTIAIVGRPNVGKSTLFNRLIGKRYAVIAEEAGTTRDRISHKLEIDGYEILLVDTGGIQHGSKEDIEGDVQTQAKIAIEEADITVFVINSMQSLTVDDFAAADILRKSKKPVILIANKCDNPEMEINIYNIYELGFGEPIAISAIHKIGIDNLQDFILKTLKELKFKKPKVKKASTKEKITNICLLGRPNAGKSSVINALINDPQKLIVSDIPGTTRDSTDTELLYKEKKYNLIDTAGIRRPGKRSRGIEKFSVLRGLQSIDRSDVVVLLIDGNERISSQDCSIASHALEAEKGLIIAINKIDLLESGEEERERMIRILKRKFPFVPWAPVLFISAKNKKNTYEILKISDQIMEEREKRIKTSELNSYLQKITFKHKPASTKIKKPKFMYASQVDINPPKFVLFFKNASVLHFSYPRYLENKIREEYGFNGTPIHLKIKSKLEPDRE
ncbi:MAG: ribosome biogenesis GTPase Der [Nitrospirota bacterium]